MVSIDGVWCAIVGIHDVSIDFGTLVFRVQYLDDGFTGIRQDSRALVVVCPD